MDYRRHPYDDKQRRSYRRPDPRRREGGYPDPRRMNPEYPDPRRMNPEHPDSRLADGAYPEMQYPPEGKMREGENKGRGYYINNQNKNKSRSSSQKHKKQKSASERYKEYLEREEKKKTELKKLEETREENEDSSEEKTTKGTLPVQNLDSPIEDDENLLLIIEEEDEKAIRKTVLLRKGIITLVFLLLSLGINLLSSFHFPLSPSIISIEFSALAELVICICVNPLIACAAVFIKNGFYYLINPSAVASIPNKIVLNLLFIIITWCLYKIIIKSKRFEKKNLMRENMEILPRDYTGLSVFIGGAISSVICALASVASFKYIIIPLVNKQLGDSKDYEAAILENYKTAFDSLTHFFPFVKKIVPAITSIDVGLFVYNVPLNMFKFLCCAALAAIICPAVNNYINMPRNNK
ncbi:MAG: hypothetical protein IJT65_01935 [Eubacterium sp.]|nr:hypothetical protein [Eubacterium sp.]